MSLSDRIRIEILLDAEKDLIALKSRRDEAIREIHKLEDNPELGHPLKGSLKGTRALAFNLKGSGAYRAVHTVLEDQRVCVVFIVGPHENIYKKAERRWESVKKSLAS